MCAYSLFNTFPVYPLPAKPLILLAFCRYRYHTSLFDRPNFNRMIAEIEAGNVGTVVVKDMSRLGRDYLKVGYYTEIFFVERDVRYIAINDGVDSAKGDNDFTFRNLFNDFYAKDTSKKVWAIKKAQGMAGEHLTKPPYGYKADPADRKK